MVPLSALVLIFLKVFLVTVTAVARSARVFHHRAGRTPDQAGEGAVRNGDIRHTVGKHSGKTIREHALRDDQVVRLGDISVNVQTDAVRRIGIIRNVEFAVVKLNIVDESVSLLPLASIFTPSVKVNSKVMLLQFWPIRITNIIVFCRAHISQVSNEIPCTTLCR